MNKDEMIEEIAEMLIDAQDKCELNPCDECEHRGCRNGCWHYLSATELYKKGGRIVADDEMVIKKSEYAKLCIVEYEAADETTREILRGVRKIVVGSGTWRQAYDILVSRLAKEKGIELE